MTACSLKSIVTSPGGVHEIHIFLGGRVRRFVTLCLLELLVSFSAVSTKRYKKTLVVYLQSIRDVSRVHHCVLGRTCSSVGRREY